MLEEDLHILFVPLLLVAAIALSSVYERLGPRIMRSKYSVLVEAVWRTGAVLFATSLAVVLWDKVNVPVSSAHQGLINVVCAVAILFVTGTYLAKRYWLAHGRTLHGASLILLGIVVGINLGAVDWAILNLDQHLSRFTFPLLLVVVILVQQRQLSRVSRSRTKGASAGNSQVA